MPDQVVKEIADSLEDGIKLVQRKTLQLVPRRTGNLATLLANPRAIGKKDKGLRWEFGFRIKRLQRDGFYAPWVEFGTKGSPKRNIPAQPAQPFMGPGFKMSITGIRKKREKAMDSALRKVAIRG